MVSGVINQLLTTTEWSHEVDAGESWIIFVIDMPPGTGDIQLTLCQVAPLTAAVIVSCDYSSKVGPLLMLSPVVENMCHFDADLLASLDEHTIRPTLSASGDSGIPQVVKLQERSKI